MFTGHAVKTGLFHRFQACVLFGMQCGCPLSGVVQLSCIAVETRKEDCQSSPSSFQQFRFDDQLISTLSKTNQLLKVLVFHIQSEVEVECPQILCSECQSSHGTVVYKRANRTAACSCRSACCTRWAALQKMNEHVIQRGHPISQ